MARNYVIIVDKSGSMSTSDCPGGKSRWDYCQEGVNDIARKCDALDPDGIDVYVFASKFKKYSNVHADMVEKIFSENEPNGSTNLTDVLKDALDNYFKHPEMPVTIVIVTDGTPDDEHSLLNLIVNTTKKMEADEQIGMTFVQVGKDAAARNYLKKLDDGLRGLGAKFDIVDTVTFEEMEEMTISQVLENAISD